MSKLITLSLISYICNICLKNTCNISSTVKNPVILLHFLIVVWPYLCFTLLSNNNKKCFFWLNNPKLIINTDKNFLITILFLYPLQLPFHAPTEFYGKLSEASTIKFSYNTLTISIENMGITRIHPQIHNLSL